MSKVAYEIQLQKVRAYTKKTITIVQKLNRSESSMIPVLASCGKEGGAMESPVKVCFRAPQQTLGMVRKLGETSIPSTPIERITKHPRDSQSGGNTNFCY